MNRTHQLKKELLALSLLTVFAASTLTGQITTDRNTNATQTTDPRLSEPEVQPSGAEASTRELKVSRHEMKRQVTDVNKASKLIGMNVKSTQNQNLGKIEDLVIDHESGRVAYAVLSAGGFFGIGDKLIAIPFEALSLQKGAENLVVNMDKQRLEQAPGFTKDNWPDLDILQQGRTAGLAQSQDPAQREAVENLQTGRQPTRETVETQWQSQTNVIIDATQIIQATDPTQFEGRQVRLSGLTVQEVIGNKVIVALPQSSQASNPLYIITQESGSDLKQGQTINIQGTVRPVPSQPESMGLDKSAAQRLQGQRFYIEATRVNTSQ